MEEDGVVYLCYDLEGSKNTSRASQSRNFADKWEDFREFREREEESEVCEEWSVREWRKKRWSEGFDLMIEVFGKREHGEGRMARFLSGLGPSLSSIQIL